MNTNSITFEAIFENGMLRPETPLPLQPKQRVTVTLCLSRPATAWPVDVAQIYDEIAGDDRSLADAMFSSARDTWPASQESVD